MLNFRIIQIKINFVNASLASREKRLWRKWSLIVFKTAALVCCAQHIRVIFCFLYKKNVGLLLLILDKYSIIYSSNLISFCVEQSR